MVLTLPEHLDKRMRQAAKSRQRTMAEFIRRCIEAGLDLVDAEEAGFQIFACDQHGQKERRLLAP